MNLGAGSTNQQISARRHRLLAGGLLITLLLSFYALVLDPWFAQRSERLDQLAGINERISRYENIIASGPELLRSVEQLEQQAESLQAEYFDQPTSALALAELQRKVKLFASTHGARLMSTQPLNQDAASAEQRIAITVSLQGDLPAIYGLLLELRRSNPALLTESLVITARVGNRAGPNRGRPRSVAQHNQQTLNVNMTLSAFWQAVE